MSKQIEALKLALEALERINDRFDLESVAQDATKAITALEKALAQQEQEPVAWINPDEQNARKAFHWVKAEEFTSPVYITPPQRKSLSYVELMALSKNSGLGPENVSGLIQARLEIYGRAIEAAHGIKE